MNRCLATKKKGCDDPCMAKSMAGHTLCGRHARMKQPLLWADANKPRATRLVKAQAVVRGFLLRKRLRLAGPGVLCRANLANDEDLGTCVEKDRQHPLSYFAFEENGKVWWFDFDTIWKWSSRSHEPLNPYTKVPLSVLTKGRLRSIWVYTIRNRETVPDESLEYTERLQHRLNVLCQIFAENGFVDAHPGAFSRFTKSDYATAFVLLGRDIETIFPDSDPFKGRALRLCRHVPHPHDNSLYILRSVVSLILLQHLHRDNYIMAFAVLSALYRC